MIVSVHHLLNIRSTLSDFFNLAHDVISKLDVLLWVADCFKKLELVINHLEKVSCHIIETYGFSIVVKVAKQLVPMVEELEYFIRNLDIINHIIINDLEVL